MLLDFIKPTNAFNPYINTGTMFDLLTGRFEPSVNGGWVLNGGLSQCTGVIGRAQTYKSTMAGSLVAKAMEIHPQAECYIFETENAYNVDRYLSFANDPDSLKNRICFQSSTDISLTEFYDQFIKLAEMKEKQKKDYYVETPFKEEGSNKPKKAWIPTFVLVDSFSRARADKTISKYEESSIDDSSFNSANLADGGFKTRIMTDLPMRAAKAGIYVIMTAHVGEKFVLDPYAGNNMKQLQFMKNTDKMKNVGSNFEFLTTALLQTVKAVVLQNKDKKCEYPADYSTDLELNEITTALIRCKNNASGSQIPFVISQYKGILDALMNFVFLKNQKNFGMDVKGNNQGFSPYLTPDVILTKNKFREMTDNDYGLCRALELIAQLCFIQTYWSTWRLPEYISMPVDEFAAKLKNSQKCSIDRVLQSTGVWSTSKQERERMTIMDVLQFLHNEK